MRKRIAIPRAVLVACVTVATVVIPGVPAVSGSGTISGIAYKDLNRNGVRDSGEEPISGMQIYLFNADRTALLKATGTDANGVYVFSALADAGYRIEVSSGAWATWKSDWVPTTTGGLWPRVAVTLSGSATVNFGWRPIVRSTDLGNPVSAFTGPTGVRLESFNDAVSARELHDHLATGSFLGAEAPVTTVRFDYGPTSYTVTNVSGAPGSYGNFSAVAYVSYASWLAHVDAVLFHEYGHAWSFYIAYVVRQDPSMRAYLEARGLWGDPRLDTSHAWTRGEMIAEDYRQLFGSPTAAAQAQENTAIPAAGDVPGLRDFLRSTYPGAAAPPPPSPSPPPTPEPAPTPTPEPPPAPEAVPTVTALVMSPQPVRRWGTVSFELSAAAAVTAGIHDSRGVLVRTLSNGAAHAAGTVTLSWNRTGDSGKRVGGGTYSVRVSATNGAGTTTAAATFTVS